MLAAQYGGEHGEAMILIFLRKNESGNDNDEAKRIADIVNMPCSVKSDESGAEDSLEWKVWSKSPEAVLSNGYENGKTALMFAAQYGGRNGEAMIRLLIDAGANP